MNKNAVVAVPGVEDLLPYIPGKPIEELQRQYGIDDVIKIASNENPLGPSPKVISHLSHCLSNPVELARYPDGNGFVLKNQLISHFKPQIHFNMEQITLGNGSNDVLDILARTFAGPGDEVVFSEYAFAVYPIVTQAVGAKSVVTPAHQWGYDLNAILDAITQKTRLIFIANPNNPTGTHLPYDDLVSFIQQVPQNIVVVLDEAYEEYAAHPDAQLSHYKSTIDLLEQFDNLVVTRTFSKAYGLASFRIGYSLSSSHIADLLNRVRQPFNNNSLALEAASVALDDQDHINESVSLNWQGMSYLTNEFSNMGLNFIPSAGNFICVEIPRNDAHDSAGVNENLLQQGVIVRPVGNYQMPDHLRISVGTLLENQRLIDALRQSLRSNQ